MAPFEPMHAYSTHLAGLITGAIRSGLLWPQSPILELGCGHYSTPLIASIAKIQNRDFHVVTSDAKWAEHFQEDAHQLKIIEYWKWQEFSCSGEWGLVFIDNEELVIKRFEQLFKLNKSAKVVVFHDANRIEEMGVSWGPLHMLYRYIHFLDRYSPTTAILSNYIDPIDWF